MFQIFTFIEQPASKIEATEEDFVIFTESFEKNYNSAKEMLKRKDIFMERQSFIKQQHQDFLAGKSSWDSEVRETDDLTEEELKKKFGVIDFPKITESDIPTNSFPLPLQPTKEIPGDVFVPDEWNWVDQGGVSPVKDQVNF